MKKQYFKQYISNGMFYMSDAGFNYNFSWLNDLTAYELDLIVEYWDKETHQLKECIQDFETYENATPQNNNELIKTMYLPDYEEMFLQLSFRLQIQLVQRFKSVYGFVAFGFSYGEQSLIILPKRIIKMYNYTRPSFALVLQDIFYND